MRAQSENGEAKKEAKKLNKIGKRMARPLIFRRETKAIGQAISKHFNTKRKITKSNLELNKICDEEE